MNVAVCGYGVVGKGVVEILDESNEFKVTHILTRTPFNDERYVATIEEVYNDETIDIVVETMGGIETPFQLLSASLRNGKHVVTSNKELVLKKGAELFKLAQTYNANFLFEGSVGGGMPVINTLTYALHNEPITRVQGILNGTSNYILSLMQEEECPFSKALQKAQMLGYAESDPTDDIQGFDSARKIAIIGSLLTGSEINLRDITIHGITDISAEMLSYAKRTNYKIKLIANLEINNDGIKIWVDKVLIDQKHPFYNIEGVNNAVLFEGKYVQNIMIQGPGAGRYPTASAVVSDVYQCHYNKPKIKGWDKTKNTIIKENSEIILFKENQAINSLEIEASEPYLKNGLVL